MSNLKALIEEGMPGVEVQIGGDGCDLCLNIISDELAALSPVKRQQQVYAQVGHLITSGALHAVNMKFFTRDAWNNRQA